MQREQLGKLVGPALAALLPTVWWFGQRRFWPAWSETEGGEALLLALRRASAGSELEGASWAVVALGARLPVELGRVGPNVAAAAYFAVGLGAWALARRAGLNAGWAAVALLAAQVGPWSTLPLSQGELAGLALGPLLLALAWPRLALLAGFWSAPLAAVLVLAALATRRWALLLALVGLAAGAAPLAGASPPAPTEAPLSAAYAGAQGAWFPLPPRESEVWAAVGVWYGGRHVHPLATAAAGRAYPQPPRDGVPRAVASVRVPAVEPVSPVVALGGWRGLGALAIGVPAVAGVALAALWLAGSRRGPPLAVLALLGGGLSVAWAERGRPDDAPRPLSPYALSAAVLGQRVVLFPPPHAPYHSGRWSEAEARAAVGAAGGEYVDSAATLAWWARATEYGVDVQAARALSEAEGTPLAEGVEAVVIDTDAIPPFLWVGIERKLGARGLRAEQVGALTVVRRPAGG